MTSAYLCRKGKTRRGWVETAKRKGGKPRKREGGVRAKGNIFYCSHGEGGKKRKKRNEKKKWNQ